MSLRMAILWAPLLAAVGCGESGVGTSTPPVDDPNMQSVVLSVPGMT